MNKQEFLKAVKQQIAGIPGAGQNRFLDYYSEMIDDRIEDGMTEQEAVSQLGTTEEIALQVMQEQKILKYKNGGFAFGRSYC